jgi:hypothetical protein
MSSDHRRNIQVDFYLVVRFTKPFRAILRTVAGFCAISQALASIVYQTVSLDRSSCYLLPSVGLQLLVVLIHETGLLPVFQ